MVYNSKVSIIVPIYNAEPYLSRFLNSLVNQTLHDIEIICINDGSTDNSLEILESYAQRDIRIKSINIENSGVSRCRNIGLKYINSKYVVFVDSDDWLDREALEVMYNYAELENSDLVMCAYMREYVSHSKDKKFDMPEIMVYENEELEKIHRRLFGPIDEELGSPELLDSLGTVWAKLYKSEIIKNNNFEFRDLSIIGSNEDSLFNIYVINKMKKVIFINKPYYHYWRENKQSITSLYNPNLKNQWEKLHKEMNQFIEDNNLKDTYRNALNNRVCMSVLGLGLNECSKANTSTELDKIKNIKIILNDDKILESYIKFKIHKFPLHWRVFYRCIKHSRSLLVYIILNTIEFLRKVI